MLLLLFGSCFFVSTLFYSTSISIEAQTEKGGYDRSLGKLGDLREDDERIKKQREKIEQGQLPPLVTLRLRYAGKRKNDLIFYDLEGEEIYYRYRKDRFDDLAEKKLPLLVKGQAYRVRGPFIGLSFQNIFIAKSMDTDLFQARLRDRKAILIFQFQSAKALLPARLLL